MPKSFLKRSLRDFDPYVPGQQPPDGDGWVKLNTNEAPWPPSPKVLEAVRAAVDDSLRLYPNPTARTAREDRVDLVREGHENLLLLRTCSKSCALAGMRIGYAVGAPGLVAALDLVKESYNLDRLAIVAAGAAIEDRDHHDRLVAFVVSERAWPAGQLRQRGFEVAPSATNFLFARPPAAPDAGHLHA